MKVPEGSRYFVKCVKCGEVAFFMDRDVAHDGSVMEPDFFAHPDGTHPALGEPIECWSCGGGPFWNSKGEWAAKQRPIEELTHADP